MKSSIMTVASTITLLTCYAAAGVMSAYSLTMGPLLKLLAGILIGVVLMIWSEITEEKENAPKERQLSQGHKNFYNFNLSKGWGEVK